jgi:hypothetical protein
VPDIVSGKGLIMGTINRSRRAHLAVATTGIATVLLFAAAEAKAEVIEETELFTAGTAIQSPQFRKGLWSFQRTLERIREAPHLNQMLSQERMTRCVDPSLAMKHIFASPSIGNCTSSRPELINNRYVFSKRCDFMGPVRTEIIVENDESYTELNVLTVGSFPRKDMVVARRIGDCDPTLGYAPSTTSDGFQLMSSSR